MELILTLSCHTTQGEITSWSEEYIKEWFENWGKVFSILAKAKQKRLGMSNKLEPLSVPLEYNPTIDNTESLDMSEFPLIISMFKDVGK